MKRVNAVVGRFDALDAIAQLDAGDRDGRQDVIAVIEGRYIDRDVVLGGNGGGGSGYAHN